jgi:hypothetical protein
MNAPFTMRTNLHRPFGKLLEPSSSLIPLLPRLRTH